MFIDGSFGFLPWMQRGLVNSINTEEGGSTPPLERATLGVDLKVSYGAGSAATHSKTLHLLGPGDILGIDHQMIVRTNPADGTFNFDDNLMAYIEFAEVDFPWRYTPARANSATNQLRSWLSLVVLKDGEFTIASPKAHNLPSVLVIDAGVASFSDIFHPEDEHWAWAHVQVNDTSTLAVSPPSLTTFQNSLLTNPSAGVSRLICPRRLDASTNYTAFLIPTFETGRQAGLGNATTGIGSLAPSWHAVSPPSSSNEYPIYYSWRFGTSTLGDFESLARALVPRPMDPSLGSVKMDISNSGMGLNSFFIGSPPAINVNTVGMEGALMPASFTPPAPQSFSTISSSGIGLFTGKLKDILNISSNAQSSPPYSGGAPANPYISGLTFTNDDPVILPPIYGQWHADVKNISSTTPLWVQQVNLDARYRAAAGIGSQVVRDNQQYFMQQAWAQVGEVMVVNDKLAKARLAMTVSKQLFQKHLVANTRASTSVSDANMTHTANVGVHFFKKIKNPALTTSSFTSAGSSGAGGVYVASAFETSIRDIATRSMMTQAGSNSGLRKMTRNRSYGVQKLGLVADNKALVRNISSETSPVKAAPANIKKPIKNAPLATLSASSSAFDASMVVAGGSGFSIMAHPPSAYRRSFNDFKAMLEGYQVSMAARPKATDVQIQSVNFTQTIQKAVDPEVTVTKRIKEQIELEYHGLLVSSPPFKVVMAYPIMDDPMYEYLSNLSAEYLLPNLAQYPNNTVTLLKYNNKFLEAYMAGLNHEFSRELLWQGYPTDQRGSYFRRFWDINDTVYTGSVPDYLYDIDMVHKWTASLGGNNTSTRHIGLTPGFLVLLIRGDLLKKYPDTLIYAQKASWYSSPPSSPPAYRHKLKPDSEVFDSDGNPSPPCFKFPVFRAQLQPDVVLLGFNLTKEDAVGYPAHGTPSVEGWYFVFRERPGHVNFGMSNPPALTTPPSPPFQHTWDNINWDFMANGSIDFTTAEINLPTSSPPNPITVFNTTEPAANRGYMLWDSNANSSVTASILFRDPVMVAIHAESLLYT